MPGWSCGIIWKVPWMFCRFLIFTVQGSTLGSSPSLWIYEIQSVVHSSQLTEGTHPKTVSKEAELWWKVLILSFHFYHRGINFSYLRGNKGHQILSDKPLSTSFLTWGRKVVPSAQQINSHCHFWLGMFLHHPTLTAAGAAQTFFSTSTGSIRKVL